MAQALALREKLSKLAGSDSSIQSFNRFIIKTSLLSVHTKSHWSCRSSFVSTHNCLKAHVLSRIKSLYDVWSRHSGTHTVSHWQSDNHSVESSYRCEESASSWLWESIKCFCLSLTLYEHLFNMRVSSKLYIKSYI